MSGSKEVPKLTPKQERFVAEYRIDPAKFWARVDKSAGAGSCWPWSAAKDVGGYGRLRAGRSRNSTMLAHRAAFGLVHGELPPAVCHTCDNPVCCNPAHLFGGTRADNNRDMVAKGRNVAAIAPHLLARGERHGMAKLSAPQVAEIRSRYSYGGVTQRELAQQHGVCQRTIAKIVNRIGWRDA